MKKLGPDPTQRAVHDLKERWNGIVNFNEKDPAQGSLTSVYKAGGDYIRAIQGTDAQAISQADQRFHKAATLNKILTAANTRRPGPGSAVLLSPYARPVVGATVGGTVGYHEGGAPGAVAGAISGAALGSLIQSPGFRYVSAGIKNALAKALDKGDSAMVSQLAAAAASQINAGGGS